MTLRITVVDDNADLLDSLLGVLEHLGYDACGASNGHDALRLMEEQPPDVALVDVGMPVMSGYQLAAAVRAQPWGAQVALVALTGWSGAEDRARATAAGFDQLLVKPVDLQFLRTFLSSLPVPRDAAGAAATPR